MTETFAQMWIALVSVIFLIVVIAFLYRKRQKNSGLISLVAYQPLGPKKGVAALKVGRDILVLGITPTDFKLLKTLEGKDYLKDINTEIAYKVNRLRRIKEVMDE